jgi:predicted RecB family endonuclease
MYQAEENVVAQRGGADRQDVLAHLIVDGRKFVDYDRWVQAYVNSSIADLHPLLIIVPPGNTATALGLATQRGHVKFIEMSEESTLISSQLLDRVRTEFRLDRAPVCVVVEPTSSSTPQTDVSVSLVLDPAEWPDWAQWTRLLHDNPVTSVVDVVLGTTGDLQRFTALDQQISAEATRTIPAQDIEFLFQLVINTISTEKALWTSFIDPRAQQRALELEEQYDRVIAVPATLDARLIARQIERLNEWMRLDNPSLPLRQRFADQAASWLEEIATHPERYPFWDLTQLDRAVVGLAQSTDVSPAICRTLGALGTPQAQSQLLLIVEQPSTPLAVRQAAAAAFQAAVAQHGIFLTREQLQRQYDRYNASAALPEEVRTLNAAILDALEARAKAAQ